MTSWEARNFTGADVDDYTPEKEEEHWGRAVGQEDGEVGGVSEEGRDALTGEHSRKPYIRAYWEGFMQRKLREGAITEDEFFFYDPYPGRWGTYWEELA